MSLRLTEGSLATLAGGGNVDKPVVQILGFKKMPGQSNSERYRLLVSDGRHTHSFAMLATQLNDLVTSGQVEIFTVVRIEKHICSMLNSAGKGEGNKRVIVILEMTVLAPGNQVGIRLGNPVAFKEGAEAGNQPQMNGTHHTSQMPKAPQTVSPSPVNRPMVSPLSRPIVPSSMNSSSVGTGDMSKTHPIAGLSPYQNKWVIKARVTNKAPIRTWSNARGEGKLFSMDLVDESGEIRATAFNEQCDKFYDMIEVNKVYLISHCTLKTANKQFTSIKNDYEMSFTRETQVLPCLEDSNDIPVISFNFVPIANIQEAAVNSMIDVIGVCKSASDVQTLVARTTNRELKKRELQVVDQTNTEVTLTLWGSQAEEFDPSLQPVVAVKGARISEFGGGKSVSLVSSSTFQINPDIPEAHQLRGWFENEGCSVTTQNISLKAGGGQGMGAVWKTFSEAKDEQLGCSDKADYYTCKATIALVKKENVLYRACPNTECNKKVVDMNNGMYRCEKCNREYPDFKWRMILQMNLADCTDNQWVGCFQDQGEQILGCTASELGELCEDKDAFNAIIERVTFQTFLFRLRVKMETYNDESRLKTNVVSAQPLDFNVINKKLGDEILEMAGLKL